MMKQQSFVSIIDNLFCKALMGNRVKVIGGYHQTSDIRCTLVANKIVDRSDVVGTSPVGAALATSSFTT